MDTMLEEAPVPATRSLKMLLALFASELTHSCLIWALMSIYGCNKFAAGIVKNNRAIFCDGS